MGKLPQNVEDAIAKADAAESEVMRGGTFDGWQTIRAHLMSQEAEIADLIGKRDFLLRHYNAAESRLAAANALLRECHCYFEARGVDSRTIGESLSLNEKIQSHLQGAGDEA